MKHLTLKCKYFEASTAEIFVPRGFVQPLKQWNFWYQEEPGEDILGKREFPQSLVLKNKLFLGQLWQWFIDESFITLFLPYKMSMFT